MQKVTLTLFKDQRSGFKMGVSINDHRVTGVKPSLEKGNIVETFQIPLSEIAKALNLEELAAIPCCHTSGMHDPQHFEERRYICADQKSRAFHSLCEALGIDPKTQCSPTCGWCSDYKDKQKGAGLALSKGGTR